MKCKLFTSAVGLNLPNVMADDLKKRAKSMDISTSKYCKLVLENWLSSGKKLKLSE